MTLITKSEEMMRLVDANAYKRILEGWLSEVHSGGDEQENAEGSAIFSCLSHY